MIKIKALKNCGCIDSFRSIKTNQEIERSMEKITEGVIRLWKKELLLLDGKTYFPDNPYENNIGKIVTLGRQNEIPAEPKKVDIEAPEGQSIDDKPIDEEEKVKTEEPAPLVDDKPEAPAEETVAAKEPAPDPVVDQTPDQEDADNDVIEAGETGDKDASDEKDGDDKEEPADKGDDVTDYVLEQPSGFFSKDMLNGYNVDELRPIGKKLGIEIKTRKIGVSDIMDKVKSVLEK